MDLARVVSIEAPYEWRDGGTWSLEGYQPAGEAKFHVVAYDFGVKRNILRLLTQRGCRLTVVPAQTPAVEVLKYRPDGVFLSNGPGDPEPCAYAVDAIRELFFNMKKKPENQDPPQEPPQNPSQPDNVQNKKKDPDAKPVVKEPKRKDIPDKKVIPQKVAKKVLRSLKPDNNEVPKVSKEDAKKIAKKPVRKEQTVISEDNEEYPAIDAPGKGLIAVVALITSVLIGAAIVSVKNNF